MKNDSNIDDLMMLFGDGEEATAIDEPAHATDEPAPTTPDADEETQKKQSAFARLKARATDEDVHPSIAKGRGALRKVVVGEMLNDPIVRNQVWVILLAVLFIVVYVAVRYQCQQDMIAIDKLEKELKDAKYRALSSSSELTEKSRETHILDILKNSPDSTLHVPELPPFIIQVPDNE